MERLAVSVAEAGEALGLGETLIRELIARGTLQSVRVGRRVLVPADALRDYVAMLVVQQSDAVE